MTDKIFVGDIPREKLENKVVLVRVDYNAPIAKDKHDNFVVANDARIRNSLETIHFLLSGNAKIVLISHLGRPVSITQEFSLRPVAERLQELIPDHKVDFCNNCIGPEVEEKLSKMTAGSVIILENLRYHAEESSDDPFFAEKLATGKDYYVNDAFSACHRGTVRQQIKLDYQFQRFSS